MPSHIQDVVVLYFQAVKVELSSRRRLVRYGWSLTPVIGAESVLPAGEFILLLTGRS